MSKAVKTVAGVAAAAVGFATGQGWLVAVGAGMVSQGIAKTPKLGGATSQAEMKQIVRSSKEPARYMVGRIGAGGLLAWAQEQSGEQSENELLHLVYVLTEGTIDSLEEIYVNQEPVANAGDRIQYELISGATVPNDYLLEHSPDWRDSQIGRGLTYVRVTLRHDPEYFATGIPDLLFVYRARNNIYDPRTGGYGYSDNAALVGLWYLRERLGVPDDEIIWEMFNEAANISHEIVTNPDGSTERRYTLGGGFKADERRDRVLADIEAACGGSFVRVGGRWGLQVGAYYGPHELVIDENMVIGTVTGQTEVSQADAVNTMRGRFVDPEQRWTETDYPAVSVQEWIEQDGGPIEDSLDLRLVTSAYQAQRLANMRLRRRRAGGRLSFPLNFRGYACRPGRVVRVELPSLNISGEFRIEDWEFSGQDGCKVTLQQEDIAIYDDAIGQPYDPMGFIRLPAGGIGSPTGLRYVVESVGEVVQGVLLWNPVEAALHYNVVIKHDGQAVQSAQVPAGVERCEIGGLVSGQYTVEVRARGRLGLSGPASINITINAPPMPERVITQIGNREITLIPMIAPGASLNGGHYRYYWTTSPGATQAQSDYLGEGLTITHAGLAPEQTFYYYVQSINAYGSSPFLRVEVQTTLEFDEEWRFLEDQIYRPGGVVEQWNERLDYTREALEQADAALQTAIDNADVRIDSAEQSLADAREAFDERLDAADGRLNAASEQLEQAREQIEGVDERVSGFDQRIGDNSASIERVERAGADGRQALAEDVSRVAAETEAALAENRDRVSALATDQTALTERVSESEASLDGFRSSTNTSLQALAEAGATMTQRVDAAESAIDDNQAGLEDVSKTLASNDAADVFRRLAMQAQALGNAAQQDIDRTVSVDERRALSERLETLSAEFGGNLATVRDRLTALTDADSALAQSFLELETAFEASRSALTSELTALSNAQQALTRRVERAETAVGENTGSIETIEQTLAGEESVNVFRRLALQAQALGNAAQHDVTVVVEANERRALVAEQAKLLTQVNDHEALNESRYSALSTENSATAARVEQVRAEANDQFANVEQELMAIVDPKRGVVARYLVTTEVNGKKAMIGMQADGTTAEIMLVANQTAIINPVNGQLVTAFVVTDGRVIIRDALIASLAIEKLRSSNGSLVFENDKLQAAYLAVEQLVVDWSQMRNVWIENAQIATAAVDTLKVRGRAITVPTEASTAGQIQQQYFKDSTADWFTVQDMLVSSTGEPFDIMYSVRARTDCFFNGATNVEAAPAVRFLRNGEPFFTLDSQNRQSGANKTYWDSPLVYPLVMNLGPGNHRLQIQVKADFAMSYPSTATPRVLITAAARYIKAWEFKR